MKAIITKLAVAVALTAMLGFFTACDDGSGGGGGGGGGDDPGTVADAPIAPSITTESLPDGGKGIAYSQTLTATGTAPITWTIDSGALPEGLTLTDAAISGTPKKVGKSAFTVKAANEEGFDTKELSITITIDYCVTSDGYSFTASGGGLEPPFTASTIGPVIEEIRKDANGEACTITMGDGETPLGYASLTFTGDWGPITLLGSVTMSPGDNGGVIVADGVSIESRAIITNASNYATSSAIRNIGAGTITVSKGKVSVNAGRAISNISTGVIKVLGSAEIAGTIYIGNSGTDTDDRLIITNGKVNVITNDSTGGVTVKGGQVVAGSSAAIRNNSTGVIRISEPAVVTSGVSSTSGTIHITGSGADDADRLIIAGGTVSNTSGGNAIYFNGTGVVKITDGTVEATANNGYAIRNNSTGTITVEGGKVSATTGRAIHNDSTGKIRISGKAEVTSANDAINTAICGTIYLNSPTSGDNTNERLVISGGTVSNPTSGYLIYNGGTGGITITDGTVSAGSGYTIYNYRTGKLTVEGGKVEATTGYAIYNYAGGDIEVSGTAEVTSATTAGTIFNYGNGSSTGGVTVKDGKVSNTATGYAISNSGAGGVIIEGGTVTNTATGYAIYNSSTGPITVKGGKVSAITGNAIYNNRTGLITISGTAEVTSESGTGDNTGTIYLNHPTSGSSDTSEERLVVEGGTVSNTATRYAINNSSYGLVTISGGTVIANGTAIYNSQSPGRVIVTGGTVSSKTGDAINRRDGTVTFSGGTVMATTGNAVYAYLNSSITINNNGTLFAYGTERGSVTNSAPANSVPTGNGLIIWWNNTASPGPSFESGATTGLYSESAATPTATVKWDKVGGVSGISYEKGTNKGFIKVDGVTVN